MTFRPRILAMFMGSAAILPGLQLQAYSEPVLAGPVMDSAVIQRDRPVPLRGSAAPESDVSIEIAGVEVSARTDATGAWQSLLPAMPAGGPYTLSIRDSSGTSTYEDIRVGDVILCSGQSNMDFPVYRALNPDRVIANATNPDIRLMTIPQVTSITPLETLPAGTVWEAATPETVRDFSAVCYLSGTALQEDRGVPVGLVDASWGGSQIEAWLSAADLEKVGGFSAQLHQLSLYTHDKHAAMMAYGEEWERWWRAAYEGDVAWTGSGEGAVWKATPAEMGDWHTYDDPDLKDHLGRVWFSKSFTLSANQARENGALSLGLFDDTDATWINGHFLGSTSSWTDARTYEVPAAFLKAGKNTIIVNVRNTYGPGGMMGPAEAVSLQLGSGDLLPLGTDWSYRVISEDKPGGPQTPWESVSGYTTIHNAMTAPLAGYPMSGAIWYQGESNTDRGGEYQALLAQLIKRWRQDFGANLPVVVVQLPGYGALPEKAGPSGWSDVREAERRVALDDARTGLAVTIDAGDRTDIHPPNKQLVAERVTDVFNVLDGQATGFADGIAPSRATRRQGTVIMEMPTDGLKMIGSDRPIAFQVCDASGSCDWAEASLKGTTIQIDIPADIKPAEVRYCWGDAPMCNLVSNTDVPVAPFSLAVD
jgi:sialate O-acetylesterase